MRLDAAAATRFGGWLAGLWAGALLAIALLAAPVAFAALPAADAGRVVGRILAREALLGLALSAALFVIVRRRARLAAATGGGSVVDADVLIVLGTLFCTVAGHYAVQPMMAAARAGQGPLSFGALHGVSLAFFAMKALLAMALAWRLAVR